MKIYKIIYIISFFLIISFPFLGMLFYEEPENTENKVLLEPPQIVADEGFNINYLQELKDWYEEHFAFRQELVTMNANFKSRIFGESSEELAIVGKDGWLYLKASLGDYQGTNTVSERHYYNVIKTIALMQEYTKGLGKKFIFTCAPNKNTLYPEYMPYYYKVLNEDNNLDVITPMFDKYGINYVDLKKSFLNEDEILYHKGDSHWNNKGAAMVYNLLLDEAGVSHTDYLMLDYTLRDDFEGDIDKILFPLDRHTEEEYDYSDYMTFVYDGTDDVTQITVNTINEDKTGGLLCYRDSFGNSLIPFLANEFNHCTFSKSATYRLDMMAYDIYDVCIIEVVERNLMSMTKFSPVMPAPLRPFYEEVSTYNSDNSTIYWTNYDNYYKITGYVDDNYISSDSFIYIRLSGEENVYTIEAFPVNEDLESKNNSDYGFTAYLGINSLPEDTYRLEVISENDGELYSYMTDEYLIVR